MTYSDDTMGRVDQALDAVRHNHVTRDIKRFGECPSCDAYWRKHAGKRVLVTGSRNWEDDIRIDAELARVYGEIGAFTLVHGDAPGADTLAAAIHSRGPWPIEAHPVNWRPHGVYNPFAGHARNSEMVSLGADLCLAFWDGKSTGTKDCIDKATAAGIPVRIILQEEWA